MDVVNCNQIISLSFGTYSTPRKVKQIQKNIIMYDIDEQFHILWNAQNSRDQKQDNFLKFSSVLYCNPGYKPHFMKWCNSSLSDCEEFIQNSNQNFEWHPNYSQPLTIFPIRIHTSMISKES